MTAPRPSTAAGHGYGTATYHPQVVKKNAVPRLPITPEDLPHPTNKKMSSPSQPTNKEYKGIRTHFQPFEAPDMPPSSHRPGLRLKVSAPDAEAAGYQAPARESPRLIKKCSSEWVKPTKQLLVFDAHAPIDGARRPLSARAQESLKSTVFAGPDPEGRVNSGRKMVSCAATKSHNIFSQPSPSSSANKGSENNGRLSPSHGKRTMIKRQRSQMTGLLKEQSMGSKANLADLGMKTFVGSQRFAHTPRSADLSLLHHNSP
jgi:hypothetical protein